MKNLTIERKILTGFIVVSAVVLTTVFVTYWNTTRLIENERWVTQTHRVLETLESLFSTLQDAERGQRGYLLTGNEEYLNSHETSLQAVQTHLRVVRVLTADNPEQQSRIAFLEPLIARRVTSLAKTIQVRRERGLQAAVDSVKTGTGRELMDEIRRVLREMEQAETVLLDQRSARAKAGASRAVGFSFGGIVVCLVLLTGVYVFIENDLAERRKTALSLGQANAQLKGVLDGATESSIISTDPTGLITVFNSGAERILGYKAEEMIGRHTPAIIHDESEVIVRGVELSRETGRSVEGFDVFVEKARQGGFDQREWTYVRKDGGRLTVSLSVTALRTPDGEIAGFLGVAHDVTVRKLAEAEIARARDAAVEAARMKSEFLANMSHEIRTPMNGIIGMTGLLLETDLTDRQYDFIETIRTSGDALLTIINDILDFSKIEAGHVELERIPFDLVSCVEEVLELLGLAAGKKGLDLVYLIHEGVPTTLVGDPTRLRQILVNLVGNAVKFTECGEIVVEVRECLPPADAAPEVLAADSIRRLEFSVKDSGTGIPEDRLDRLFRSFSQVDASTSRRHGGTGLGLAISKRLVEMMGGVIGVRSRIGEGSTFVFTIEVERGDPPDPPVQPAAAESNALPPGKRILIVDDNDLNLKILRLQAEKWGGVVETMNDPRAALDLIKQGESFDAAILDFLMDGLDGLQLAAEIRALRGSDQLPIILLSSASRQVNPAEADAVGLSAVIAKPVRQAHLRNVLAGVFGRGRKFVRRTRTEQVDPSFGLRHPFRILLAEDNRVNQKVALLLLERLGYRADVAANGLEVLDACATIRYDVVLMDVQMPEMDGIEATKELARRFPSEHERPYVIALTANALAEERDQCLASGMADFLTKPVKLDDLSRAFARYVGSDHYARHIVDLSALADELPAFDENGGNPVTSLASMFLDEGPATLEKLRAALEARNADQVRRLAHSLKGNAGQFRARPLRIACAELERLGRADKLDEAAATLAAVEQEWARVRAVLNRHLNAE